MNNWLCPLTASDVSMFQLDFNFNINSNLDILLLNNINTCYSSEMIKDSNI